MVFARPNPLPGAVKVKLGLTPGDKVLGSSALVRLPKTAPETDGEPSSKPTRYLVATEVGLGIGHETKACFTPWVGIERIVFRRLGEGAPKGADGVIQIEWVDGRKPVKLILPNSAKRLASIIN